MNEPKIINGGISIDDRGNLTFNNDFSFIENGIERYYMVNNHKSHFIRAWHGHKKEEKFVTVVNGDAIVACVKIDNWDNPSKDLKIYKFILSDKKPSILYIPKGYANGFMNLTKDTKIIFFSTSSLDESKGDDFRYNSRLWDCWNVIER